MRETLSNIGHRVIFLTRRLNQLEEKVAGLEHFSNQQSILVDTLGSIMEELKRQERSSGKQNGRYLSG